jgi:L-seryl-tRNA(Ser) seleniumtransferase
VSHPTIVRAVASARARIVHATDCAGFEAQINSVPRVKLVTVLRLRAESELIPLAQLEQAIGLAKSRGIPVYLDDAAGARLCPVAYDQPKPLELGVDLAGTGMDKTGLRGPRFGILAGTAALVNVVKAKAFDHGLEGRPAFLPGVVRSLEAYSPAALRVLVDTTRRVGEELRRVVGDRVTFSPATVMLRDEEILSIALERGGRSTAAIVPLEASATLSMLLLQDYGIVSVHATTGWPSFGGLLVKDIQPEVLDRLGGAKIFAAAVDTSLSKLAKIVDNRSAIRTVLFGTA